MTEQFQVRAHVSASKLVRVLWATLVLTAVTTLLVFPSAFAAFTAPIAPAEHQLLDEAIGGRCVPAAAKEVLRSYRERILNASTADEARELVLSQTRLAHIALKTASWVLPFSDSVRQAREKIEGLEARVYAANSQAEVADDFSDLIAAGHNDVALLDGTSHAVFAGASAGGCSYTNTEIVIIVIGFICFIIPGIIFLIIFC